MPWPPNLPENQSPLPDYIRPGLNVLFVGFNPGERSAAIGHHYAGRNNRFWELLDLAGFTERRLRPEEDSLLLTFGYGLTNIVARWSKSSSDLRSREMFEGAELLRDKVARFRPAIVGFCGKGVYQAYARLGSDPGVGYGRQDPPRVPGTIDFIMPSPSGRATAPFAVKLHYFRELRLLVDSLQAHAGDLAGPSS